MRTFPELKLNVIDQFKLTYLNLFQLAHAIRIVYSSGQGELEENSFWGLVFEKNKEVWEMVRRAYEAAFG
jgi:hypothetical protein